jgi:nickel transport protein
MSSRVIARPALAVLLLLATTGGAAAHEVLHEIERGSAVSVRVRYPDGRDLADARAEVYSPADRSAPAWTGRTDRNGRVAFVPDAPGIWGVRVVDGTGHGTIVPVEVPAPGASGSGEPAPDRSSLATVLRPVVGVAIIAGIAAFLHRRSRRGGPA